MARNKVPSTPAIRALKAVKADYTPHAYTYEQHGGTQVAASELGVREHTVIKTLVMEDDGGAPLIMLMHGDREVSTKNLAREIGTKSVKPCDPATAERHTGYHIGGTSPFGTRKKLPVYAEATILDLDRIWINGGTRGLLVEIDPALLISLLAATSVSAAQ